MTKRKAIRYVPQNHIDQRDKCGVACVAMICSKDFEDVEVHWHGNRTYTGLREMENWLTEFGAVHNGKWVWAKPGFNLDNLAHDAVLLVDREKGKRVSDGHWVVWDADRRRGLDPWDKRRRVKSVDVDRYLVISNRP